MTWKLSCRKTRRVLALAAGNDLKMAEHPECERHLALCPSCRETWQRLAHSQKALEQARMSAADEAAGHSSLSPSVWPSVARHIRAIDEQESAADWRGWLPAGALAAACLAVIMVAIPDPPSGSGMADNRGPAVIVTQPADGPAQFNPRPFRPAELRQDQSSRGASELQREPLGRRTEEEGRGPEGHHDR